MEAPLLYLFYYVSIAMCCCTKLVHAIESPNYRVLRSESDFQIRLYSESSWLSAPVGATSFNQSTKNGFHRLYKYIHGDNLNSSKLAFTAPVLTSISSSSGGNDGGYDNFVRIYVSAKYQGKPPQPNPQLNLQLDKWRAHCIAVRKFSGFAQDDNINKEFEALVSSLNKHLTGSSAAIEDKGSFTIAQYNSSRLLSGRLNEVWINVSGSTVEDCPP